MGGVAQDGPRQWKLKRSDICIRDTYRVHIRGVYIYVIRGSITYTMAL